MQSHSHAHVCVGLAVDGNSGLLGRWGPVTSSSAVRQSVWVSLTTVTKETECEGTRGARCMNNKSLTDRPVSCV